MSITVNQIVLHQLVKHAENETTTMESVLRDELLTITQKSNKWCCNYIKAIKIKVKHLVSSKKNSIFAQDLNRLLENEINFLNFSQQSTKLLAQELGKYNLQTAVRLSYANITF